MQQPIEPPLLRMRNVGVAYGEHQVLSQFNLVLQAGACCALLGEEGAGKSTLQKAITQQLPYSGEIIFKGSPLAGTPTHKLPELGIGYVLQGGNILKNFTVEETLHLALRHQSKADREAKWEIICHFFPKIPQLRSQQAGRLSGGERMLLSLAGIAIADAALVILDEPTAGLAPEVCDTIKGFLEHLKQKNTAILLLEHNFEWAKEVADEIVNLTN